jgi:hypothetical protein
MDTYTQVLQRLFVEFPEVSDSASLAEMGADDLELPLSNRTGRGLITANELTG